jgi:hypothetical protein
VQQHLRRLDGVAKVDVSLLDGKVAIFPKTDGHFDPASVLKATYDSGVSLVEMTMVAEGNLVKDPAQGLILVVAPNQSFPIDAGEFVERVNALAQSGARAKFRGRLFKKPPGKQKSKVFAPLRFEVLEVM